MADDIAVQSYLFFGAGSMGIPGAVLGAVVGLARIAVCVAAYPGDYAKETGGGRGGNKRGEEARGGDGDERGKQEWVKMVELERPKWARIEEHQGVKVPLKRL